MDERARDQYVRAYRRSRGRGRGGSVRRRLAVALVVFLCCVAASIALVAASIQTLEGILQGSPQGRAVLLEKSQTPAPTQPVITENTPIRVVIKTSGFEDVFHKDGEVRSASGILVHSDKGEQTIPPNTSVALSSLLALFDGDKPVRFSPLDPQGALTLPSVKRSCGHPDYVGFFDVYRREQGFVLVNELPLDDYVCGVVPSEMPESYGLEALKAQSVCARSYAALRLSSPGYPEYNGTVDDSVRYQVYNNASVSEAVKEAVEATAGEVATWNGERMDVYFCASTCGVTAGGETWGESGGQKPYLEARSLDGENQPVDLREESALRAYLEGEEESNYEKDGAWYRWELTLDLSRLGPSFLEEHGKVKGMHPLSRSRGGVITSLRLECEKKDVVLESEYDVRDLLGDCIVEGTNRSGSVASSLNMLPSACFFVRSMEGDEAVLRGGGYGHGVGMSQTAARGMARAGLGYQDILSKFYGGIVVKKSV